MGAKVALKAVLLASLVLVCRRGEGLVQFFIRHGLDSKPGLLFLSASVGSVTAVFWFVQRTFTSEFGSLSSNTAGALSERKGEEHQRKGVQWLCMSSHEQHMVAKPSDPARGPLVSSRIFGTP